jgi:DNA (cytosine-5)-methyltransferase 1
MPDKGQLPVVLVAHALSSEGADASEDGTGRETPIVMGTVRSHRRNNSNPTTEARAMVLTRTTRLGYCGKCGRDVEVDWCPKCQRYVQPSPNDTPSEDVAPTLRVGGREQGAGSSSDNTPIVAACLNPGHEAKHSYAGDGGTLNIVGVRPRRLTPRECERLQGFPDDWTLIDGASDSARYRTLGNAVAVPCVEWIIRRLIAVDSALYGRKAA